MKYLNFVFLIIIFCSCREKVPPTTMEKTSTVLNGIEVSTFMYQIQELDDYTNIDLLAATEYNMLVVEPGFNFRDSPYDVAYLVSRLKQKPNGEKRILLAYIDIGQAEDYRDYWQPDWIAPTSSQAGYPDFLVSIDPDGWSGNYPVAYWDAQWQDIWLSQNGLIEKIASYGFDGVYLDWVEAYDDDMVRMRAEEDDINPENTMIKFMEDIKNKGRTVSNDFLVVAQNAPYLLDANPSYYRSVVDAISVEDTWFYGEGDEGWDSIRAGDLSGGLRHAGDYSTANRIRQSKKYLEQGIPVFTVDYCRSKENADMVYQLSRSLGFIPLVTRVSLSRITETPPF